MDLIFSRVFWGVIIIVIGILVILNAFFKFHIPVFRLIFAFIFIYIGINILLNSFPSKRHFVKNNEDTLLFSEGRSTINGSELQSKYSVVFGSQVLDFRNLQLTEDRQIELNSVFASQEIFLHPNQNFEISASSSFASIDLPDRSSAVFGDTNYRSSQKDGPVLRIKANAVFGSTKFRVLE